MGKIDDVDALQTKVNENGGVGIICAKRFILNKSGHVVVVPETETEKAFRVNGKVIYPLQSQAGMNNYNYFRKLEEHGGTIKILKRIFISDLLSRIVL
jgi:hypothetical protein